MAVPCEHMPRIHDMDLDPIHATHHPAFEAHQNARIRPCFNIMKAGVVPLVRCRGLCIPLCAVFPPLQVVLSSACSVASLSRFPSHYLPGHPHLREGALAAYLFGQGSPSTWFTGLTVVHDTPSAKLPCGAQRGMTLPRCTFRVDKMQATCLRAAPVILGFFFFR